MNDDGCDSTDSENPHPAPLFDPPDPDGQDYGQQPGYLSDHAVSVLELHAADEFGDFIERAERSRPVGDGESGVVAGDQGSGDDKEKRPAGEDDGEAVKAAIVSCGDGFQSWAP